jgi:hypothetical protein
MINPRLERNMPESLDVTGLPGPMVNSLKRSVEFAREHASPTPDDANRNKNILTPEQWQERWTNFLKRHRVLSTPVDDSRESIYAGRGE